MRKFFFGVLWFILQHKRKRLIPDAYFDENKRLKLCRIDNMLIKLKRIEDSNNG